MARGSDDRPALRAAVGAGEQVVLAAEGDRPDGAFDGVGVELDAAVTEEAAESLPAAQGIGSHRRACRGAGFEQTAASSQAFIAVTRGNDLD